MFLSKIHSLTVADVEGSSITIRQVSASGEELDRFTVTKRWMARALHAPPPSLLPYVPVARRPLTDYRNPAESPPLQGWDESAPT